MYEQDANANEDDSKTLVLVCNVDTENVYSNGREVLKIKSAVD